MAEPLSGRADRKLGRWDIVLASFSFLVAATVRLYYHSMDSLRGDEMFSRTEALLGVSESLQWLKEDAVHPPLFVGLQAIVLRVLPDSVLSIRLTSLVAGALLIPLAYVFLRKMDYKMVTGLLAASILTLSPDLVRFSAFARGYSIWCLISAIHLFSLLEWQRSRHPKWLLALSISAAAMAMTHAFSAPILLMSFVIFQWHERTKIRNTIKAYLPAFALGVLWFIPSVLSLAARGLDANLRWNATPEIREAMWIAVDGFIGLPAFEAAGTAVSILIGAVLIVGLRSSNRLQSRLVTVTIILGLAPIVFQTIAIWGPMSLPFWGTRFLLFSFFCLALLLAVATERSNFPGISRFLVLLLLITPLFRITSLRPTALKEVAEFVDQLDHAPNEILAFDIHHLASPLSYYLNTRCVDTRLLSRQLDSDTLQPRLPNCPVGSTPVDSASSMLLVVRAKSPSDSGRMALLSRGRGSKLLFQTTDRSLRIYRLEPINSRATMQH